MTVTGYFTLERHIIGLTTKEIERVLGFRPGRLTSGARVVALVREPRLDEFDFVGSTRFSGGKGLGAKGLRRTKFVPGAWSHERLVKVEPDLPHTSFEWYPPAWPRAAEQWKLTKPVPGHEIARLKAEGRYWG